MKVLYLHTLGKNSLTKLQYFGKLILWPIIRYEIYIIVKEIVPSISFYYITGTV